MLESVEAVYIHYIEILKENGQYDTALRYKNAIGILKKFKKKMHFKDVTPLFLQRFEKWMVERPL